jgi:hypothetical protein
MAQGDYLIQNQSFPSFRSDLNSTLEAINTSNSGTSRPSSAVAGTVWLDTTSATTPTLKFYDGADDISLATLDYTANTVNWLDSTVVFDIVGDTTPQLGGDLDVNGNSIVSVSNGNITFTPDGTGKVIIDGLSYPTADGTNGQALITDGSGNLSFGDVAGGTNWQSSIVTGTTLSAVAGNGYWINTTSNACTVTLPASASVGDTIEFSDYLRTWGTNAVTINTNSLNFQGSTSPNPEYNTSGQSVRLVYSGATQGWIPTVDDDVTLETPQTHPIEFLVIAGGAGGAGCFGGAGGGAGGYRTSTQGVSLSGGTVITVTVGSGGAGTSGGVSSNSGSDSSISGAGLTTITSAGGGGAGARLDGGAGVPALTGGSGGGGADTSAVNGAAGNTPSTSPSQGNAGGAGRFNEPASGNAQGGGGGAGGAGGDATSSSPYNGGAGGVGAFSSITGSSVERAGGGGGGARLSGNSGGTASGGGGAGGVGAPVFTAATAGTANTGGGGGGVGNDSGNGQGQNGGSGVVILSVATANYSGTTTGSPTVTTTGSNTVMQFNGSGSYTT